VEIKDFDKSEEIKAYSIENDVMVYNADIMHNKGERISPDHHVTRDTFFRYPLYYGKTWTIHSGDIKMEFEVDGEGIIITPDSLEYKALRVKTTTSNNKEIFNGKSSERTESVSSEYNIFVWIIPEMPYSYLFHMIKHRKEGRYSDWKSWTKEENEAIYYKPLDRLLLGQNSNGLKLTIQEENGSELKVLVTLKSRENVTLAMTDMSGKIIYQISSPPEKNSMGVNGFAIPSSNLVPGNYIISVISETAQGTIKWVKK
jgi:hypothetical protein